jgi:hypothetical protein
MSDDFVMELRAGRTTARQAPSGYSSQLERWVAGRGLKRMVYRLSDDKGDQGRSRARSPINTKSASSDSDSLEESF